MRCCLVLFLLASPAIADDYFGSILIFDAKHVPATNKVLSQGRAVVTVLAGAPKKFKLEVTIFTGKQLSCDLCCRIAVLEVGKMIDGFADHFVHSYT